MFARTVRTTFNLSKPCTRSLSSYRSYNARVKHRDLELLRTELLDKIDKKTLMINERINQIIKDRDNYLDNQDYKDLQNVIEENHQLRSQMMIDISKI